MKKTTSSYNSGSKVAEVLRKDFSLSPEQVEALQAFLTAYEWSGDFDVTIGDCTLQLHLRGLMPKENLAIDIDGELFAGRVSILQETLWQKTICTTMQKAWQGAECLLSYGAVRHQLCQLARGYLSALKSLKAEEKAAYRKIAAYLQTREATQEMLGILGKIKSSHVNTFEYLPNGRLRVAFAI